MRYDALYPDHKSLPQCNAVFSSHSAPYDSQYAFTAISFVLYTKTESKRIRSLMTRKAPIVFVMSILPSVCPRVAARLPLDGFRKFFILGVQENPAN